MKAKNKLWIFLIVLCAAPALWGIFHPGFFISDDGSWMVIRLSAFYSAFSSGQFPTRFLPQLNNGFGYPVADFLYPLFLYVGSVLHVVKIPFVWDVKLILAGSIILSGIGMYLFLTKHFSKFSSFFGAITYIYLPYHLYDVYVRGSVGEVVSLAVVPFLFWAIEKDSLVLSAIFLGFLIPSHNTLALFFLPFAVLYALVKKMSVKKILAIVALGLGLSAFFWMPALFDKQFTVFDSVAVANPSMYFVDRVSYLLIGWIALATFGAIFFFKSSLKDKYVIFFFLIGLISLFSSFSISSVFWHSKLLSEFVQFPFRFLSIFLICEAFLAGYCIEKFKNKMIPTVLFVLILFASAAPYIVPKSYSYQPDSFYATNVGTTTVQNEYMPKWVTTLPTSAASHSFTNLYQKGTRVAFTANMEKDAAVTINFVYFPGWVATVDKRYVSLSANKSGLLQLQIPKGQHTVDVWFTETPFRLLADIISLVSAFFLLGFWMKKRYEK